MTMFFCLTLPLFVVTLLTYVSIVRDVFPHLDWRDQECFRAFLRNNSVRINGPIGRAWDVHVRLFPKSWKRVLFACLFTASLLSVGADPVLRALGVL